MRIGPLDDATDLIARRIGIQHIEADFEHGIIDAFYRGMKHRPDSTFGTFNDDILAFRDPQFRRIDLCSAIMGSRWRS